MDDAVSGQRTLCRLSANGNFCGQQGKTKCQSQNDIAQQKYTAAILGCQIRKSPNITETNSTAGSSQHETDGTGKITSLLFHVIPP